MSDPNLQTNNEHSEILNAINELNKRLDSFETFTKRRFDEVSMEVNAGSQLLGMAEESMGQRFGEVLEVLGAVSFHGDGGTAANAGVELDAVIQITEQAANRILDAADRIAEQLGDLEENDNSITSKAPTIHDDINEILMACTFQDLTGQRIRKTLDNLQAVESRLGSALEKVGLSVPAPDKPEENETIQEAQKVNSQAAIDELFD